MIAHLQAALVAIFALLEEDITPSKANDFVAVLSSHHAATEGAQARWVERFERVQIEALNDPLLHTAMLDAVHQVLNAAAQDDDTLLLHAFLALTCALEGDIDEGTLFDVAVRFEARLAEAEPYWVAQFHVFKRRQELGRDEDWLAFVSTHLNA